MKRFILLVAVCVASYTGHSQVGIGNVDPKSSLDISASNVGSPSNTDGILIPRVDNFPSSDPGADQDGMLVFVTGNGTPTEGFYYWDNGSTSWVSIGGGSNDSDWYEAGTTTPANDINDNIYHLGNVTVGTNTASTSSPILVQGDVNADLANISSSVSGAFASGTYSGLSNSGVLSGAGQYTGIANTLGGSNDGTIRGINNSINNSGTGQKIGMENTFNSADGVRKGFRNYFAAGNSISMGLENQAPGAFSIGGTLYGLKNDLSSAGNGQRYGVHTVINGTGTGAKYGEFIQINSAAGGQHYGVYSRVEKASGYAGFFIGRSSFGTDASTGRYLMPAADGTAGQVMATNGSGQLSFVDAATEDIDWYEVGTTTAPDAIGDDMFTQGNVVIGATTNPANVKFYVESDPASNTTGIRQSMTAASSGLLKGIENLITANGTTNVYALSNSIGGNSTGLSIQAVRNSFSGSGGRKTGMLNNYGIGFGGDSRGLQNDFNSSGITGAIGVYNAFSDLSASGYGYGSFNTASSGVTTSALYGNLTSFIGPTVSGSAYGEYSRVETSGTDYAIYGRAANNAIDYAAYFVGRASFGTNLSTGRYLLPAADGSAGQVMTTDGSGQLSFSDFPADDAWYEEGTTNAPNAITDNIFTQGRVGIGDTTPEAVLDIAYTGSIDEAVTLDVTHGNAGAIGTGLEISARSSDTGGMFGAVINMDGTVGAGAAGVVVNNSSTSGVNSGFYANVTGNTSNEKTGLISEVTGTGSTNYGIKSYATGATTNWAGYFGDVAAGTGNVYVKDLLDVDGTLRYTDGNEGMGRILASNATGNATWVNPSAVFTDTDDQTVDTFALVGNNLGVSLEDDGQPVQTVDLSNVNFNVTNFALAKMTMSATQSLTGPAWTKQNFDTVSFDIGSNFNTTNDRFEVTEDGYYRINATGRTSATNATTNQFGIAVRVNGSAVKQNVFSHHGNGVIFRSIEALEFLSSGDYVEIFFYTESNIGLGSSSLNSSFEVERIR